MKRATQLLALSLALLLGLSAGLAAQEDSGSEQDPAAQQESSPAAEGSRTAPAWVRERQFERVGVALFGNLSDVEDGGKRLSRSIFQKLKDRAGKVEFVKVDRTDPDSSMSPSEARDLGDRYNVDAVIWGILVGVRIPSGTFPSRTNRRPMARARANFYATGTEEGQPLVNHWLRDNGMKHYSWSVGNEYELYSEVIHRLGNICWRVMKDEAIFAGVEPNIKKRNERREAQKKLKQEAEEDEGGEGFRISPF